MSANKIIAGLLVLATFGAIMYLNQDKSDNLSLDKLQCIARNTMVARGKAWVDKKVPYSQTSYYEGYRQDCSGFVSMCWELGTSMTTESLPSVAPNITKADLLPGDAILCREAQSANMTHHVVLFVGWNDSSKTHYHAYEEANTQLGTISHIVEYPYNYKKDCFHPIRYKNVC